MKKLLDILKNGSVIFTVITLIFYSAGGIISGSNKEFIPSLLHIWLFFLFSVLLALANSILRVEKMNKAARLGLHFIAAFAVYFVTVIICGGYIGNGAQTLIAITVFLVLYLVFAIIFLLSGGKKKEDRKYESMFK